MTARHEEYTGVVDASVEDVFSHLDDQIGGSEVGASFTPSPNHHDTLARALQLLDIFASRRIRRAAMFFNIESLTDVRLSRYEPIIRPRPAEGGRLTVDPWAPLEGCLFNLEARYAFH